MCCAFPSLLVLLGSAFFRIFRCSLPMSVPCASFTSFSARAIGLTLVPSLSRGTISVPSRYPRRNCLEPSWCCCDCSCVIVPQPAGAPCCSSSENTNSPFDSASGHFWYFASHCVFARGIHCYPAFNFFDRGLGCLVQGILLPDIALLGSLLLLLLLLLLAAVAVAVGWSSTLAHKKTPGPHNLTTTTDEHFNPTTNQQGWRSDLVSSWRRGHTRGSRQDIHNTQLPDSTRRVWLEMPCAHTAMNEKHLHSHAKMMQNATFFTACQH